MMLRRDRDRLPAIAAAHQKTPSFTCNLKGLEGHCDNECLGEEIET